MIFGVTRSLTSYTSDLLSFGSQTLEGAELNCLEQESCRSSWTLTKTLFIYCKVSWKRLVLSKRSVFVCNLKRSQFVRDRGQQLFGGRAPGRLMPFKLVLFSQSAFLTASRPPRWLPLGRHQTVHQEHRSPVTSNSSRASSLHYLKKLDADNTNALVSEKALG